MQNLRCIAPATNFFLILLLVPALALASAPSAEDAALFENKVRPLLADSCYKCHGAKKQESGLRLDSLATMMRGGDRGPAIVPGAPEKSLLIDAVSRHGEVKMPPDAKLPSDEVALLTTWVKRGAPWPSDPHRDANSGSHTVVTRSGGPTAEERRFWSFQPIAAPAIPNVRNPGWCKTPIDAFVLARQEASGVVAVRPADKRTLFRRATFDLTGLPPTPADVADFLADVSPDAFARVVDRLLASSAYGERWGRHWLDVVRYADTAGETADYPVREAYKYRNYVINAFNADKPYDEFLREQIAGDILAAGGARDKFAERLTATGFIAISRRFGFDPQNYQHLTIQDTIDTIGQSMLGLTIGCARCHDHKFDPISSRDYYALYGIFASTNYSFPGSEEKKRPNDMVPLIPAPEVAAAKKAYDEALARLAEEAKQNDASKDDATKKSARRADIDRRRQTLVEAGPYPVAYGVSEGTGKNARIQMRGEPTKLGDEVPRRFLEILRGDSLPANAVGSGRLELSNWLTRPNNPLTARVMANRIWQHHFGYGIVHSENDFGARGMRPTHPQLLDFLATQFIASGWSIKAMHRLIMLSQTYQLSAADNPRDAPLDPVNDLLWHFNRSRLDAESIRDSMLALGGNLDTTMAGAQPFPPVESWNFTQHNPFDAEYDTNRRTVYLMTSRLRRLPYFALFDGADPNATTARRMPSIVPTQALFLMNSPFVHAQSNGLAARLLHERPDDASRIDWGYELALARPPNAQERSQAIEFLQRYREQLRKSGAPENQWPSLSLAAFARTLMVGDEFLYVE
jgi:cytochrome c553